MHHQVQTSTSQVEVQQIEVQIAEPVAFKLQDYQALSLLDVSGADYQEDDLIVNTKAGIAGVSDGLSAPFDPVTGPELFKGQSGGQLVTNVYKDTIAKADPDVNLKDLVNAANENVATALTTFGLSLQDASLIPGATGALFKVSKEQQILEIVSWGDSFVVWERLNGRADCTHNQVYQHDQDVRPQFTMLMKKHRGNRTLARREFAEFLAEVRNQRINNTSDPKGYGLMNGQAGLMDFVQFHQIPLADVKQVIAFTDGLIPYEITENNLALAKHIIDDLNQDGLTHILRKTRREELITAPENIIKHAEATAVHLQLTTAI